MTEDLPQKFHPRSLPPDLLREQAVKDEAYRLRMAGSTYGEIATVLKLDGGWKAAYRIVAEEYGELVARLKVTDIRVQEAGRLMELRAGIESLVRQGEQWAIDADLKMTKQISELLGLPAASEAAAMGGGGSGGGPNVQINIAPPWERGGVDVSAGTPAPDVIEGEAVEEA
jgi:hypothetical protein